MAEINGFIPIKDGRVQELGCWFFHPCIRHIRLGDVRDHQFWDLTIRCFDGVLDPPI